MKIHLPAEIWEEILKWLNRREFAKKMEQLWDREFTPIAEKWLHEWSRNNKIGRLKFLMDSATSKSILWGLRNEQIPIAVVDMPKNIRSFEYIKIRYLDSSFLAFLHKMQPLLHNIHLAIIGQEKLTAIALDHLLPLFRGDEFEKVELALPAIRLLNNNHYSSALLNTKLLEIDGSWFSNMPWCFELLANWLFTKRADGKPRMMVIYLDAAYKNLVAVIQERFMAAREAFPFIIRFYDHIEYNEYNSTSFEDKTIKNVKTGQQLIMRGVKHGYRHFILFISCSLDINPEHLAKWDQKLLELDTMNYGMNVGRNCIHLDHTLLGPPFYSIYEDEEQQSGSSSGEANAQEKTAAGTSNNNIRRRKRTGKACCLS